MDIGSLLIVFALLIIIVAFIARPLLEKHPGMVTEVKRYGSELRAERDQILMNLQELDMDHAMGKISADEYENQRIVWVARGAAIMRELDRLDGVTPIEPASGSWEKDRDLQDLETQIEMEILRRRGLVKEGAAKYCPQCGIKLQAGDRFCTRCGSEVNEIEAKA
jgi:hypothetical protein